MGKALNLRNDLVYIDVRPNNMDYYGMKIQNNTATDLHFLMLAFDIGDLDISKSNRLPCYFLSSLGSLSASIVSGAVGVQSTGGADPNLYAMKFLPIGYGNGGETPLGFKYPGGKVNVTILKMYFTTHPMDLKWLEQATPFTVLPGDPQDERGLSTREEIWRALNASNPTVFTKSFTIVQRAHLSC